MDKLSCIVVEDEPLAAEILADYIAQVPFLELAGVYGDALYAMEALQQGGIEVMFLDIHLPKLKGLDFIRTLKSPPQIIITTAYRDYAVEGYELNVVDYLLKPVSLSRFIMAVNKLKGSSEAASQATASSPEPQFLLVNINKKKVRIAIEDICFIESRKEYICIVTATGSYLTKLQLSETELQLDRQRFLRIHRSFIVALSKITAYNAAQVEIGEQVIPIGRSYKEAALAFLKTAGLSPARG